MVNKFIYLDSSIDLNFDNKIDTNINILGIFNNDSVININCDVFNQINSTINILVLGYKNANIKINLDSVSHSDLNNLVQFINIIAVDNSNISVILNSTVDLKYDNNNVDQKINGILLSKNSNILGIPKLKIDSLTTNAKHALNIGGINLEEIFYLKSKGFDLKQCNNIILNSYINKVLDNIDTESQQKYLNQINQIISNSKEN